MGSVGAMKDGSKDRYGQGDVEEEMKLVPEGIEGQIPYKGLTCLQCPSAGGRITLRDGVSGLKKHSGVAHQNPNSFRSPPPGLREGHVHDVFITKEAPNYRSE